MPNIPSVLILDDGELDDVQLILEDLEVDFGRVQGGAIAPNTPHPRALLLATPRRISAVKAIDAGAAGEEPPVRVVVVDQDSRTLRDQLRRVGFDYLVRRPVHPEALRLLVMHSLYRGEEKRREPRVAVGLEISFRTGEIPRRATLVDLSSGGCRLISSFELEAKKHILVTLPESVGATEAIVLEGKILRSSYDKRIGEEGMYTAAVKFENMSADLRNELEWIIEDKIGGPPMLDGAGHSASGTSSSAADANASAGAAKRKRRTLLEKDSEVLRRDPRAEGAPRKPAAAASGSPAAQQPLSIPVDVKMARSAPPARPAAAPAATAKPPASTEAKRQAPPKPTPRPGAEAKRQAPPKPTPPPAAEAKPVAEVKPVAEARPAAPPAVVEAASAEQAPAEAPEDRRSAPRHPYAAKVPAFGTRALRVLVGRDLSVGGMRIESNPDLEVGDRLHLAIYGAASEEPFLVWGTVARGDARGGSAVIFDPVHVSVAKQLEALVASLPSVESLRDEEADAMGTVLSEIINE